MKAFPLHRILPSLLRKCAIKKQARNSYFFGKESFLEKEFKEYGGNKEAAKKVGEALGKRAIDLGIKEVCFDRAGYIYHGRVKELADGARSAGLNF